MDLKRLTLLTQILVVTIPLSVLGKNVEGSVNANSLRRSFDDATLERIFKIAERIGKYSETVPNLFRVVKRNLNELEREVKLNAVLPSRSKLEAFRAMSAPFNRFLREGPKEYYIHNPPRGSAYNVQLKSAKEVVRDVYRELQTLWLADQ